MWYCRAKKVRAVKLWLWCSVALFLLLLYSTCFACKVV